MISLYNPKNLNVLRAFKDSKNGAARNNRIAGYKYENLTQLGGF